MRLPHPAKYTPWSKGVYDVAPSLKPLGTDFGNGVADEPWFQFDTRLDEFLLSKRSALAEDPAKYVHRSNLSQEVETAALAAMGARLASEYPELFRLHDGDLFQTVDSQLPSKLSSLEALAQCVQEDICIVQANDQTDWIAYLHVCSPSHWRPSEKLGKPFFDVHDVIPGFDKVNRVASSLVDAMINKGPFVRFVWGIESDQRPNHHPDPPPGANPSEWEGRDFSSGKFWVRTERQVIWGLPEVKAALFTIKVSHMPDTELMARADWKESLVAALNSMSPAARQYKGLAKDWDRLLNLLTA